MPKNWGCYGKALLLGPLRLGKNSSPKAPCLSKLGVWRVFEVACALRPAVTVLPLRHFARQNCALGEDAISCTACLAHEGTKPRRSIKRRDFRDGSHRSGASAAGRLGCNSHSVCAPLSWGFDRADPVSRATHKLLTGSHWDNRKCKIRTNDFRFLIAQNQS
jgi:hypothetical protein